MVIIKLSDRFPQQQPTFQYMSPYVVSRSGAPFEWSSDDYPYSPRWPAEEMVQRAVDTFKLHLVTFRQACMRELTKQ